ncbi:MAG: outer membrane beta-barrel protein [Gemmatimonadota bacterium]
MKTAGFVLGALLALGLMPRTVQAQSPASHYHDNNYEFNLHAGALFLDDEFASSLGEADDTDGMVGLRFLYNTAPGWGFGANLDWVPAAQIDLGPSADDEDLDINVFLYSAEVDYTFPSPNRLHLFLGGGVGAATISLEDAPSSLDDSETDFLVPLAVGLKWFSRTTRQSWAFRAEVRDNIIWRDRFDTDEGDVDPEATHNLELSGGISFFFGA